MDNVLVLGSGPHRSVKWNYISAKGETVRKEKREKPHPKSSVVVPLWCRLCPSIANTTSSRESDKTTARRVTTAAASPTHPALIPLLLCSFISRPHGTHPPLPAKPPLIIDLKENPHTIRAQRLTHTHASARCLHKTFFMLHPRIPEWHRHAPMTGTLA